jgi:hypothetical protein
MPRFSGPQERGEVIGRYLPRNDAAHRSRGVVADPALAHAEPEKAHHALELLLLGQRPVAPGGAPFGQVAGVEITEEDDPVLVGECGHLLFEDLDELLDGPGGKAARRGIGKIGVDSLFHGGET